MYVSVSNNLFCCIQYNHLWGGGCDLIFTRLNGALCLGDERITDHEGLMYCLLSNSLVGVILH